jgi:hypothetical protein
MESFCLWRQTGQGRAGQGGQGRHPPTGPAGGPQQQPVDLWPHLDQSDGCVRGKSAQRLVFSFVKIQKFFKIIFITKHIRKSRIFLQKKIEKNK